MCLSTELHSQVPDIRADLLILRQLVFPDLFARIQYTCDPFNVPDSDIFFDLPIHICTSSCQARR
jgi:hypothetical protein